VELKVEGCIADYPGFEAGCDARWRAMEGWGKGCKLLDTGFTHGPHVADGSSSGVD
jgi:hypothetical protein